MRMLLHQLDLHYAAMTDSEVEELWRSSGADEGAQVLVLVRQLVLRALDVIELTCDEEGRLRGLSRYEIERASDETVLRLFTRLHADRRVNSIRALAHALACDVIADPSRRRSPDQARSSQVRPRLAVVKRKVER